MIYEWKDKGWSYSLDPQTAGEEIVRLRESLGRPVAPEDLVSEAAGADSVFHPVIWRFSDAEAALAWRKQEARQLIGDLVVKVEGSSARPPAFLSVTYETSDGHTERGYVGADEAVAVPVFQTQAINEALRALNGWRRRHRHIEELRPLLDAIEDAWPDEPESDN